MVHSGVEHSQAQNHGGHRYRAPDGARANASTIVREGRIVRVAVRTLPAVVRPVQPEQVRTDRGHEVAHDDQLLGALGVDVQNRDLAHHR